MGWGIAAVSATAAWDAQKRNMDDQAEFDRRYFESQMRMAEQEINKLSGIYSSSMGLSRKPKLTHPSACDNCGSSEYQHHHGRLICSYCRSAP